MGQDGQVADAARGHDGDYIDLAEVGLPATLCLIGSQQLPMSVQPQFGTVNLSARRITQPLAKLFLCYTVSMANQAISAAVNQLKLEHIRLCKELARVDEALSVLGSLDGGEAAPAKSGRKSKSVVARSCSRSLGRSEKGKDSREVSREPSLDTRIFSCT
jgi:hypothetical protein